MRKLIGTFVIALVAGIAAPSFAGDIMVEAPWARASAGMAKAGAAFMTIKNMGGGDRLVAAKSDVGKRVELHTHIMADGIMKMRKIEAIDVPANGMAMLKPGGHHVMFMGLNAPLKEGSTFPLTLVFEKAGEVNVEVAVQSAGAMGAMKGMKHDMGAMKHNH